MVNAPVRVMFVTPELAVGGFERVLANVLPAFDRGKVAASLVCVGPEWEEFPALEAAGVQCLALTTQRTSSERTFGGFVSGG